MPLNTPLLHYGMNQASGSRIESIAGTRNLVVNGTVGSRVGRRGKAAVFSAASPANYLSLATGSDIARGDTDWTIALWVQFDASPPDGYVLTQSDSNSVKDWYLNTSAGGLILSFSGFDASNNSIGLVSTPAPYLETGRWHFVAFYHSATRNKLGISLDGNPPNEVDTTGPMGNSGAGLKVGVLSWASVGFSGAIDNLWLFGSELSLSEIRTLYAAGAGPEYPYDRQPIATAQSGSVGTNAANLAAGLTAWNAAKATLPGAPVHVMFIGDSITQGFSASDIETTGYTDWFRVVSQQANGGGGRGYFPLSTIGEGSLYSNLDWELGGGVINPSPDEFGLAGYCKGLSGGGGSFITAKHQYGDTFDIHLLEYTGTGQCTVQIGSETPVTIGTATPTSTPTVNRYTVTSTTIGTRDIKIAPSASVGVNCFLVGISARVSGNGVIVHQAARAGMTSAQLFGSANLVKWVEGFSGLPVKLVFIATSVNDYAGQTALATYKANVERAILKLQSLPSSPSIVLVACNPRSAGALAIPQTSYNTQLSDLATQYGLGYVSMYDRWMSVANGESMALTPGAGDVHPTDLGHEDYAANLLSIAYSSEPAEVIPADVYDTFDGSTDAELSTHTGQIGATWTRHPGGGNVDWTGTDFGKAWRLDGSGGVYPSVFSYKHVAYLASGIPSTPEFDIRIPFSGLSDTTGDNLIGVFFFGDASTRDFWLVGYNGFTKEWRLGKVVAGTYNGLGTWGDVHSGYPIARSVEVRVRSASPKVSVHVDGVQRITSDDSARPGNRIGVYATCGNPPSPTTGLHVTQLSAGPVGYSLPIYSVSGPSSGPPGFLSSNYSVSLYAGENPGSVTITPSVAGIAGAFAPTSITLTDASRSGTFTFTPTGSGTATISFANNIGALDPPSMTYTSIFAPPERVSAWTGFWSKFHTSGSAPYLAGSTNLDGSGGYYLDKDDHYDPILVYYMVQAFCIRNGLPITNWADQIQAGITRFRDRAVRADPGLAAGEGHGVQEYHRYATGIAWHHFTTGSTSELAKNIEALGYLNKPNFGNYFEFYSNPGTYREAAFVLNTLLDYQLMGLGDVIANVKEAIRTCLYQNVQTSIQGPTRRYGISIKPFMVGINNWTLSRAWELYRGSADSELAALVAQIPASIKAICQYMWDVCWYPVGTMVHPIDEGDWDKGSIAYKDLALSDPMFTPMRGLDITTYTNRYTFRGPASLSTTDDYYKDSVLRLIHPTTGDVGDAWLIDSYTGSTRQIVISPAYRPNFDYDASWAFDIVPAMWKSLIEDGDRGPAPAMNGMAMFGFAFTYWHMRQILGDSAGSQEWRIRAHQMFNGATQAWQYPYDSKTMHQGTYLAIPALEYLARGDSEWPVATAFTFQAPATGANGLPNVASGPFRISIPYGQRVSGPEIIAPAADSGLGTFSAPAPILTNSLRKAMFTYIPDVADDGDTVQVSAVGSSIDPSGSVGYRVGAPLGSVTSYSLDGPTAGEVNVSAGYFTVTLGTGTLAAPVQITPQSSSGTGLFFPTHVDLTDSIRSAIFQYIPSSVGARTISVSNNRGLTNPGSIVYNAIASTAPPPAPVDDTPKPATIVPVPMVSSGGKPSWMIKT